MGVVIIVQRGQHGPTAGTKEGRMPVDFKSCFNMIPASTRALKWLDDKHG